MDANRSGNAGGALCPYDMAADRAAQLERLASSPEIDALTSEIDVYRQETIVTFGAEAAKRISRVSDEVLRSAEDVRLDDSEQMLLALSGVMDKFDPKEFSEDMPLLERFFSRRQKQTDKLLAKYQAMGEDIDRIYVALKQYQTSLNHFDRQLEDMFQAAVHDYHELVKYVAAGEQGCREIAEYAAQREADLRTSGDEAIELELVTLRRAQAMLERRVQDLHMAENVAMQAVHMLRHMQASNRMLGSKIDTAFLVALPIFKQGLAQAVTLKRRRVQAEAMAALNERTAAAMKCAGANAQSGQLVFDNHLDALKNAWQTIVHGVDETRAIQTDAAQTRAQEHARLEEIRRTYQERTLK